MESGNNDSDRSYKISDHLSESLSRCDELRDMKTRLDVNIGKFSKVEMDFDDLLSPVIGLHKEMLKKIDRMEKDKKVVETVENIVKNMSDQLYVDDIEMRKNILKLKENALSQRINQLNDEKEKLCVLENSINEHEKEKLELEHLIDAAEAEFQREREIFEELSLKTATNEITEREAECRRLENVYSNLEKQFKSESLKLQALFDENNNISGQLMLQDSKYRNLLSIHEHMITSFDDCKAKYKRNLENKKCVVMKLESIENELEDAIHKSNLINQKQDMFVKLQSNCYDITNKIKSEFGDVQSFDQMILKAKAKLTKFNVVCQTINSAYKVERAKKNQIEKRELMLLTKETELKETFDQILMGQWNKPTQYRNENDSIASSSKNYAVDTEHEFVRPVAVSGANVRIVRKLPSRRPQAAPKVAVVGGSAASKSSQISPAVPTSSIDQLTSKSWKA